MPQISITKKSEYLKYLSFIVDKNKFSSSEFIKNFSETSEEDKIFFKKNEFNKSVNLTPYNLEVRRLNKKLRLLQQEGIICKIGLKPNKSKKSKGGLSGLYRDNSFEYFLTKHLRYNLNDKFSRTEIYILASLLKNELGLYIVHSILSTDQIDFKNKEINSIKVSSKGLNQLKSKRLEYSEIQTIDDLFTAISKRISYILSKEGLKSLSQNPSKLFNLINL